MIYSSDLFDLTNWKLTLPVDAGNGIGGTAVEIKSLLNYQNGSYFFTSSDRAMVFRASADGATTSGSRYARSELREMNGTDRAAWSLSEGGTMTASLKIDQAPLTKDGQSGRIVVGQIHGQSDELVRLYWDDGKVYFKNDQAGSDNKETAFSLFNAKGEQPDIALGEKFSYKIDAHGDTLSVTVYADGETYTSTSKVNPVWQSDNFYFKAGAYLGVNETNGSGTGQVSFYGLDFSHKAGDGLGGLPGGDAPPSTQPVPPITIPPVPPVSTLPGDGTDHDGPGNHPVAGRSIAGTGGSDQLSGDVGNDTLYGRGGDDVLKGAGGNDTLWGNAGNDKLVGGAGNDWLKGGEGKDTYVFSLGHGNDIVNEVRAGDTLVLPDGSYVSADAARAALTVGANGVIELRTGDGSSITFTGSTLAQVASAKIVVGNGDAGNGAISPPAAGGEPPKVVVPQPSAPDDGVKTHMGTATADVFTGTGGVDKMYGKGGADILLGGAGNDELWGNDGSDRLTGGAGNDWMKGGSGTDTYVFGSGHGHDVVHEFRNGDTLVLDDLFDSAASAKAALSETDHGILLSTGADSDILFTGTSMAELQNAHWAIENHV